MVASFHMPSFNPHIYSFFCLHCEHLGGSLIPSPNPYPGLNWHIADAQSMAVELMLNLAGDNMLVPSKIKSRINIYPVIPPLGIYL